jgi:hypothetical protein
VIVTNADLNFARAKAFERVFPSGFKKHIKEKYAPLDRPYAGIHACVNSHVGIYSAKKTSYVWSTTLWIITQRMKRKEQWRDSNTWIPGSPSSKEHLTIVARLNRKLERIERRNI